MVDSKLAQKKCGPCHSDTPPLKGEDLQSYANNLPEGWKVVDEHHLVKQFKFKDFKSALAFTNTVGAIAEEEGHHPDIQLGYGMVEVQIHTHFINGLSENDFILAAKIDEAA